MLAPRTQHAVPDPVVPLVVQVGFAGSRRLICGPQAGEHEAQVRAQLRRALMALPGELGLTQQHFIVGISQLAAGADMLFTEVLAELGWQQRVFLPQQSADYLAAVGSRGPDFTPEQRERAQALFCSAHIIERLVVTSASQRSERFEDTNLDIVAESDVLVCLRRDRGEAHPGGSAHVVQRAAARGMPVLELVLRDAQDRVTLEPRWHRAERFKVPVLPEALHTLTPPLSLQAAGRLPTSNEYATRVKEQSSTRANARRKGFASAASVIVGTHIAATFLALVAMKVELHPAWHWVTIAVLLLELALLAYGAWTHWRLHHGETTKDWAVARLCAEIARSVSALDQVPAALRHLQLMPFPLELRPLLRTMNVLHLSSARVARIEDWTVLRDRYLRTRIRSVEPQANSAAQLPYYARQHGRAVRVLLIATWCFTALSALAFMSTLTKISLIGFATAGSPVAWTGLAGVLAVLLPVAAVGAMSLAAAFDLEGRAHTFADTHRFLAEQADHIAQAASAREFATLALQTETRLLGETLNWFARRAYTSVA